MPGFVAACLALNASALVGRLPSPIRRVTKPGFGWNVLVMLMGTIAGQAISFLLSPILTRLYNPTEFGYLSVYSAVLGILVVVASLGLELAIPISLTEFECANL